MTLNFNFHIIPQVSQALSVMNFKSINVGDASANLITNYDFYVKQKLQKNSKKQKTKFGATLY